AAGPGGHFPATVPCPAASPRPVAGRDGKRQDGSLHAGGGPGPGGRIPGPGAGARNRPDPANGRALPGTFRAPGGPLAQSPGSRGAPAGVVADPPGGGPFAGGYPLGRVRSPGAPAPGGHGRGARAVV